MTLALGSLLDLNSPPHNPQSMQFYQLARASLALESVLEEQSIAAIQALVCFSVLYISILTLLSQAPHVPFYVSFRNVKPKMDHHGNYRQDGSEC